MANVSNFSARNKDMGLESGATSSPSSSPSASAKRGRDPEDDVYIDNLHSHKRYLSEIMASSLNGLTVGDTMTDNLIDYPARSESTMPYHRDETCVHYSSMSEDSDDSKYYENNSSQPESCPTSPVSPYRCQKPFTSYPWYASSSPQPPRQRGSDTEGRFPSSPSDICHSADLRRAALLRSVQMRTQPSQFELQQESGSNIEAEERSCSYMKIDVNEKSYCIPVLENGDGEKSCGKGNESSGE